jgi:hypothetical protein
MGDERQQESGHEPEVETSSDDQQRVPAPTTAIEDLDASEQAEEVKGGWAMHM